MDSIYHEKQEGSLCAVHCINALLQSSYFSAVDLAALATRMDTEEQQRMAELGTNTTEYRDFIKEGSNNMDDSGMFSIQVVSAALEVWGLCLTPFTSTVAASACSARNDPTSGSAYICNMREHWFTIRRLGIQWFNLNSLLAFPELLSNTYLSLFLAQLQTQGYNIYLVEGVLPHCPANDILCSRTVTQDVKPPLLSELADQQQSEGGGGGGGGGGDSSGQEEDDLAAAMAASLADTEVARPGCSATVSTHEGVGRRLGGVDDDSVESLGGDLDSEQRELERALQLSLTEHLTKVPKPNTVTEAPTPSSSSSTPDEDVLRRKRLQFFDKNPPPAKDS